MRAKLVERKAYVFDLDDTLIKTEAKVRVKKNGRIIRSMTPEEFNFYQKAPDEELDLSDFNDARFILKARKFKMWPAIVNMDAAIKQGRSNSVIYILTARSPQMRFAIQTLFRNNHIDIPDDNIITIGDNKGEINIPEEKRKILNELKKKYTSITFFDDNPENIKIAYELGGIRTRLIDSTNI